MNKEGLAHDGALNRFWNYRNLMENNIKSLRNSGSWDYEER